MRLLAAAFAASLIAGPAFAQGLVLPEAPEPQTAPQNTVQALQDCVLVQAKRLEISGEGADIVAAAAVTNCNRELTAAAAPAGGGRANAETRQQLKDAMRDAAIVEIVEARAAAHTPPPPAPPPEPKPKPKPARKPVAKSAAKPAAPAAPAKPVTTVPR